MAYFNVVAKPLAGFRFQPFICPRITLAGGASMPKLSEWLKLGFPSKSWRPSLCCLLLDGSALFLLDGRQTRGAASTLSVVELVTHFARKAVTPWPANGDHPRREARAIVQAAQTLADDKVPTTSAPAGPDGRVAVAVIAGRLSQPAGCWREVQVGWFGC
jgi:hypothetical protein